LEKLKALLEYAYENVRYYTNTFDTIGFCPADVNSINDLKTIPILSKAVIRENFADFKSKQLNLINYQKRSTGGTTGIPHKFYSDMNTWALHWALKIRAFEEADFSMGEKMAVLAGASLIPNQKAGLKRQIWNQSIGFVPLSMTSYSDKELLDYYEIIKRKKIRFLRGYPTAILQFAEFLKRSYLKIDMKAVITTAEVLQKEHRVQIEDVFNCKVFDQYGCADAGGHAFECRKHNGLHWAFEASILESETNGTIENGGEAIITGLTNYAMPVIRYKPGDIIIKNKTICSCGKQSEMISEIMGRTTEIIKFFNGRSLAGPAFTLIFRKFNIEQYQLVQNSVSSIDVNIVPKSNFDTKELNKIIEIMKFHCGEEVIVKINKMDSIPLTSSGKFRFIISNLS